MARGIDVVMKMEGGDELRRLLRKQQDAFLREMAEALPQEGERLMSQANAAAPSQSGQLVGSAEVTSVVQEKQGRVRVAAAYTDEKAAAVHEGVHWGRKIQGTRGFKWFEKIFNLFEPGFVSRVAERLRKLVR